MDKVQYLISYIRLRMLRLKPHISDDDLAISSPAPAADSRRGERPFSAQAVPTNQNFRSAITSVGLVALAFVIYMANMRAITSADNQEAGLVAMTVATRNTVFLDELYKTY